MILPQTVVPPIASSVIHKKYKEQVDSNAKFIVNNCTPRTPMMSGYPAIFSGDKNNMCKVLIANFAPYIVTLERDDTKGILETEKEELIPLTDDVISSVWNDIYKKNCLKIKIKDGPEEKSRNNAIGSGITIQRTLY
jgi:hypothetical protein